MKRSTFMIMIAVTAMILFVGDSSAQKLTKQKLTQISDQMFAEGNQNFILVEGIRDSIIRLNKDFRFIYNNGVITVDDKPIPPELNSYYATRMKQFFATRKEQATGYFSMISPTGYDEQDILDSTSVLRRSTTAVPGNVIRTRSEEVTKNIKGKKEQAIYDAVATDNLADTSKGFCFVYNMYGIFVDEQKLTGKIADRYKQLCIQVYGFEATNEKSFATIKSKSCKHLDPLIKQGSGEINRD